MTCLFCNNKLKKNATKFCSKQCEKDYAQQQYILKWKEGIEDGTKGKLKPTPSRYVITYFNKQDQICASCGLTSWNNTKIKLEIDHINGNRYDNSVQNLRLLCPNCHSQTDTFRNKKRV